jgi:hypothetical protein
MLALTTRDQLAVRRAAGAWTVTLQLGTSLRPYSQPDDLEDTLTHFARLPTERDARELLERIRRAGMVDERYWCWVPREAGRFGGLPVAVPQDRGSFRRYRFAAAC